MKVLRYVIQLALGIGLTFALQRWDKRRNLDEAQRARAWNTASWGSALYGFGPLSLLAWFWVTRRGWPRIVYGVASTVALGALLAGIDELLRSALGMKR
ncbi:MAG: transcriptional regulator [Polyangiaceae bacterium]